MKIRNGFVSNSSSSSFILKKIPDDFTEEQVYDFYGMTDGHGHEYAKKELADLIVNGVLKDKSHWCEERGFIFRYFKTGENMDKFYDYYDFNFKGGYGSEEIKKILKNPDDYYEFSISDHSSYQEIGCAYSGSFITKNGIEINCH